MNRDLTSGDSQIIESKSKEEQEKEFVKLGLPLLAELSSQFSNVMNSANIDYDTFSNIGKSLETRVARTRQLVLQCEADGGEGEFIKEMKEFLEAAEFEVDKACADIARSSLQKKYKPDGASSSQSLHPQLRADVLRTKVTFRILPDDFLSAKSNASDSGDER